MVAKFYKFLKRLNSTKQPSGSGLFEPDCKLKQNCSEHDPVLIVATNAFDYSYVYIDAWKKYYFVRDVVSLANGLVEYHLTEDVLATYKTDIMSVSAHILYASRYDPMYSADPLQDKPGYDKKIIDPRMLVKNTRETTKIENNNGLFDDSWYILLVLSGMTTSDTAGFGQAYLLNEQGMASVRQWFCDTSVMAGIKNYIGNPMEATLSCIWVPYNPNDLFPAASQTVIGISTVQIGNRDLIGDGKGWVNDSEHYLIRGFPIYSTVQTINLSRRYKDFRSCEPYTTGTLWLPGIGSIEINMGDLEVGDTIKIIINIEIITGNVQYIIMNGDDHVISSYTCNVAAQCPLGNATLNGATMISSLGATIGGAAALVGAVATGGSSMAIAAGAGAMIGGMANTALAANKRSYSISGGYGARMTGWNTGKILFTEFTQDTEDPAAAEYVATRGRPIGVCDVLSECSGFVQCEGASVNTIANEVEKEEINNYLNSGFYLE